MSRVFDEALMQYRGGAGLSCGGTFPPVDIFETEKEIVLKAELPGLEIDDITIEVKENLITLRGERKARENRSEENYHRMERFYGAFERVFSLPNEVKREDVRSAMQNGVLEISVAKAVAAPTRSVKIRVE
ncbi:MAG: Hsp20/alpha crystallin family protein [Thermodesulfobacteriota bacterium]